MRPAAVVFCACLAAILTLQWRVGAFSADLAGFEDEPSHAVSSLLVADYLRHGLPGDPISFAESYYVRYPKVAIGHWPPLYHVVQGLTMAVFGRLKEVMIGLQAVVAASLAAAVYSWTSRTAGPLIATATTVVFLTAPIVVRWLAMATPDILLTAFGFAAMALWQAYAESGSRRHLLLGGSAILAALATHPRGLSLLSLPVVAGYLSATASARRRRWLWAALALAVLFYLPNFFRPEGRVSLLATLEMAGRYLELVTTRAGWPVAALAAVGAIIAFRERLRSEPAVAMLALFASGLCFHSLVGTPISEHYVLPGVLALALLFGFGCKACLDWAAGRRRLAVGGLLGLTALIIVWNLARLPKKPDLGYHLAEARLASIPHLGPIRLIAGDPLHEGAFIVESALADPNLERVVLRASKALASSTWAGRDYRVKHSDAMEVRKFLDQNGVSLAVVQPTGEAHIEQLLEALRGDPANWSERPDTALDAKVFVRTGPPAPIPSEIRIDMRDKLGREFVLRP